MEQKTHFLTPTKCDADVRLLYGPNRTPNESGFRFDRDSRQHLSNDNQKKLNRPTRREGKPTGDGKIGSAGECRIPSSGWLIGSQRILNMNCRILREGTQDVVSS
ncbi:unnamed protein product [Lathyrus oleraceus]